LAPLSPFSATPTRPAQLSRQGAILQSPLFTRRNVSFNPSTSQRSFFNTLLDQPDDYSNISYSDYSEGDIY